jgi:hypothetical protein
MPIKSIATTRSGSVGPFARRLPARNGRHAADQRDEQPGSEQRQRCRHQHPTRTIDAAGDAVERERRGRDEAAGKSASGLVVAAEQQEYREQQEERHQQPYGGAKDR